jgi:hypothetical protein
MRFLGRPAQHPWCSEKDLPAGNSKSLSGIADNDSHEVEGIIDGSPSTI